MTFIRGLFGFAALTIAAAAAAQSTKAPADVHDLSAFGIPPAAKHDSAWTQSATRTIAALQSSPT
ncbi:hypothetical protein LFL97_07625 [Burkholderia sp. JSH-S8]|nr:hypothetical protein LFL97_07625 [Burkholderia sp. JSH-S8]